MTESFQTIVPIVTPYGDDGAVSCDGIAAHAQVLAEAGVDGFFVCGTNGEGPLLTDDEVVTATRAVAGAAAGCRIIPQVGRPSTRATRELLLRCVDAGATAVAVVTPYFFKLTDDGARGHYHEIIDTADGTPVLAYVIPAFAGNDLSPDLVAELAAAGLAGLKDSTKSRERHEAYVAVREVVNKPNFETFVGEGAMAREAFRMGSSGVVPAVANFRPDLFVNLNLAMTAGDDEQARELQAQITDVGARCVDIAAVKRQVVAMMTDRQAAYPDGRVRSPLR